MAGAWIPLCTDPMVRFGLGTGTPALMSKSEGPLNQDNKVSQMNELRAVKHFTSVADGFLSAISTSRVSILVPSLYRIQR